MGAAAKKLPAVTGSKGGEAKQKQPSVALNGVPSLSTARILYMWSWGPIVGPVNGLNSVKLDGTPVVAADGTVNYPGFKWQFRSGELNQTRLEGNTESSNEIAVGQELRSTTPYLHTISNAVVDAVRIRFSWPQLQSQDSSGNINGVAISYAVDISTDNGPFLEVLASSVDRKNVTKYERSHRIELPAGSRRTIRARRITPEANSSLVQDGMVVEAIAEVVDSDQEYPLTAVSMIEYDAQLFGGDIAKIAVLMRGRIVRVPSNYDAANRIYATSGSGTSNGVWDGTFKEAYTNNPAWVFYDLVLHPYYGLGERIDATMVDRWSLYRIAQYCDQSVPDGKGGQQPRFTCNLYLQKQAEAYAVLQDLASIFNGMAFWDGSQIVVNADMPGDPVFSYNQSMILNDGEIRYSGIRWRDRHTTAMVAWDNPDQDFETDHEPVFDEEAIAELGQVRELTVDAFGCTSLGQAQRAGQWALMTEQLQTRTATMKVGLEGQIPRPGQVIAIADPMLSGRANGGRIAAVAGRVITLDRDADIPTGARLLVNLPSGRTEARVVRSFAGRAVTVMADYTEAPVPEAGWALDYDDLQVMQFYVRNITRPEWHQFQFEMIQHEPAKFPAIDSGAVVDPRPISVLPIGVQEAPARVLLSQHVVIEQGIAVTMMTIAWDAAPGAVSYDVEWRWGAREWIRVPRTAELAVDVRGIYSGQYMARVRAVSALNVSSVPTTSMLTNLEGKTGAPPALASLTATSKLFGIGLNWAFPPGAEDTQRTEIWYGPGNDLAEATKLSDLAYPQSDYEMQGLAAGVLFFFWGRLVDRTGNVGPFYPVLNGVAGRASDEADPVLDLLAGKLTKSQFGQDLVEEFDGKANQTDVDAQIAALEGQIGDLTDALVYDPDEAYVTNNAVRVGNNLWTAIANVPAAADGSNGPPNPTYWVNSGQVVREAGALAAQVQQNTASIEEQEDAITAQAQRLEGVETELDGKASATAVSQLSSTVEQQGEDISAQGQAITSVTSRLGDVEDETEAQAGAITNLQTSVTKNGQDITAIASRTDGIFLQVNPDMAGDADSWAGAEDTYVGVYSLQSGIIEGDYAQGQRLDTVEVRLNGSNAAITVTQQATIRAQSTADSANSAAGSAQSTANSLKTQVDLSYQVRLQANANGTYAWTGYGLGLTNAGGVFQSQFVIAADRFILATTDGAEIASSPFAVVNSQTFIKQAFIQQASIQNLLIGSYLQSSTLTSYNQPVMTTDYNSGVTIRRHPTKNNTYAVEDPLATTWYIDGRMRVRIGSWD